VTAILGFTCTDGILIFGDSEGSYAVTKAECDKVRRVKTGFGMVVAGISGTIDDGDYALHRLSRHDLKAGKWEEVEESLDGLAHTIYAEVGSLDLDMLLAVRPPHLNDGARMFRWLGSYVYPIKQHACAGSGAMHLDPQLRMLDFTGPSDDMFLFGVKLILDAKRFVQGVGGDTDAILLSNEAKVSKQWGAGTVREMESLVYDIEMFFHRGILGLIAGNFKPEEAKNNWQLTADALDRYRERCRQILGRFVTPSTPQNSEGPQ